MNAPTPDLIAYLAEYFTGQDLMLSSVAMAGPPDSTAYRRALRYFQLREAFGVPGTCEFPDAAREHILSAFSQYVTAQGGAFVVRPPAVPKRCITHLVSPTGEQQCARVLGHEGSQRRDSEIGGREMLDIAITVDVGPGAQLNRALEQVHHVAKTLNCFVAFEFNTVRLCVGPNSDLAAVYQDFDRTLLARKRMAERRAAIENPLVGKAPTFDARTQTPVTDDLREIWNWWNTEATLDTMARFYEFLKGRNLAR